MDYRKAFDESVPMVFRFFLSRLRDHNMAEELTMNTEHDLWRFCERHPDLPTEAAVSHAATLAHDELTGYYRHLQTASYAHVVSITDTSENDIYVQLGEDDAAIEMEAIVADVRTAVKKLAVKERTLVQHLVEDGETNEEYGKRKWQSRQTVNYHLQCALQKLRTYLS